MDTMDVVSLLIGFVAAYYVVTHFGMTRQAY